jgi:hypothetical protein
MNALEFIATMTGHLAWPLAFAVAVVALRDPLLRLLKSISTVRYGGAEVLFEREAVEVRAAIKESAEAQGVETEVLHLPAPTDTIHDRRIGQIINAWKRVEDVLCGRLYAKAGVAPKRSADMLALAIEHEVLTRDQIQSLQGLRVMRNLAVHAPGRDFDEGHVTQFVVLADALVTLLSSPDIGPQPTR